MGIGYKGIHPTAAKWRCMGYIDHLDECVWVVYAKPASGKGWVNYKVVAEDRASHKANYWVGWNGSRFGASSDYIAMAQNRPELAEALLEFVREDNLVPARDAEPDPDGYDLI